MSAEFRGILSRFPAGVTVVLSSWSGELRGMTVSAFCSLSLDPPLVLFCPALNSAMGGLREGDRFTVSLLGEGQQDLSERFAVRSEPGATPIEDWPTGDERRLRDCIAALACTVETVYPGGDHWIVVGRVTDFHDTGEPDSPLVYAARRYRRLAG